jgi:hypothetical protein
MDITRRDIFQIGGKLLVLASAGATLEQITGAEEPPASYRMADHWGHDHRHRQVHRMRQLRARVLE